MRAASSKIGATIRDGTRRLKRAAAEVKQRKNYAGYWENGDGGVELRVPNAPPAENVVAKIRRRVADGWEKVKDKKRTGGGGAFKCKSIYR